MSLSFSRNWHKSPTTLHNPYRNHVPGFHQCRLLGIGSIFCICPWASRKSTWSSPICLSFSSSCCFNSPIVACKVLRSALDACLPALSPVSTLCLPIVCPLSTPCPPSVFPLPPLSISHWPSSILAFSRPDLMWRRTVFSDIPRALAASVTVQACLVTCPPICLPIPYYHRRACLVTRFPIYWW